VVKLPVKNLAALECSLTGDTAHDPALLMRGSIAAAKYQKRIADRYPAVELVAKLNVLRKKCPALAGGTVTPIESSHKGALVWVKSNGEENILLIANLTGRTARLALNVAELKKYFTSTAFTALLGPASAVRAAQGRLFITLPAHGFLALNAPK